MSKTKTLTCRKCGAEFQHEVKGPGRYPGLCPACRKAPKAEPDPVATTDQVA